MYIATPEQPASYLFIINHTRPHWNAPHATHKFRVLLLNARTQPSFNQTDDGVDAETSLSLSLFMSISLLRLYTFFSRAHNRSLMIIFSQLFTTSLLWNSLPSPLRSPSFSLHSFRQQWRLFIKMATDWQVSEVGDTCTVTCGWAGPRLISANRVNFCMNCASRVSGILECPPIASARNYYE